MAAPAEPTLTLREVMLRLRDEHALVPSYHMIWSRIADGTIAATRGPGRGGAWLVRETDLPEIAAQLRTAAKRRA